jgi:hypothetical protein
MASVAAETNAEDDSGGLGRMTPVVLGGASGFSECARAGRG